MTERKTYYIEITETSTEITISEVAPRNEEAHHIVGDDYEIVVYGDAIIDTFVAIEIGRWMERKES